MSPLKRILPAAVAALLLILSIATTPNPTLLSAARADGYQQQSFVPIYNTLPDGKLNFDDDSADSCCGQDYASDGRYSPQSAGHTTAMIRSSFGMNNPRYLENSTPPYLVSCQHLEDLPASAPESLPAQSGGLNLTALPIGSYTTEVTRRPGAVLSNDFTSSNTSDFHLEMAGGQSSVALQAVQNYSICMARGNNVAQINNSQSGSVLSYNGDDHIILSGKNTDMFTRTGAGNDLVELFLTNASPTVSSNASANNLTGFNIYKTAISGGSGNDILLIQGAPFGTKWCNIGSYQQFGETFFVVEIALPPSVTSGPHRQRISIGKSIETVIIKGKRYNLQSFLEHGVPADAQARSIPINGVLP